MTTRTRSAAFGWRRSAARPPPNASTLADGEALSTAEWRPLLTEIAAFRGVEPIGPMGLVRQRASRMAHHATIVMASLRVGLRGTGAATAQLDVLVAHARAGRIRQPVLAVSAGNPAALRFHACAGFAGPAASPVAFSSTGGRSTRS